MLKIRDISPVSYFDPGIYRQTRRKLLGNYSVTFPLLGNFLLKATFGSFLQLPHWEAILINFSNDLFYY